MNNLFLTIDSSAIDWARAQFALTAIYHWLFVPLTLGLAVVMGIVETCWYRTLKRSEGAILSTLSGAMPQSSGNVFLASTSPWV